MGVLKILEKEVLMNLKVLEEALEGAFLQDSTTFSAIVEVAENAEGKVFVHTSYEVPSQEFEYNGMTDWIASDWEFQNRKEFLSWVKEALR